MQNKIVMCVYGEKTVYNQYDIVYNFRFIMKMLIYMLLYNIHISLRSTGHFPIAQLHEKS